MIRCLLRFVFAVVALMALAAAGMALLKRALPSIGDEDSDEVRLTAIGEGRRHVSRAAAFRGGSSLSVMGATRIDLRQATPAPGGAHLRLQAFMSAVKVIVPEGWLVRTELECANATVVDRSARAKEESAAAPDLVLSGRAVASAVAVSNKAGRTAAEAPPQTAAEGAAPA
jgi:hypothetical protein